MTAVAGAGAVAVAAAATSVVAALTLPARARIVAVGVLGAILSASAGVAGLVVLSTGESATLSVPWLLPLTGIELVLDPLGAWFVVLIAVVGIASSVYGMGYVSGPTASRAVLAGFAVFLAAMLVVPAAASVSSFLVFWELMAVSSLVLVLAEQSTRAEVRKAGLWYGVMTHLGFLAVLAGFALFAADAGGESFAALRATGPTMGASARSAVFLAVLLGFGSKAGMVPLHVWLPRAHPEAPSHVSALMSGAMVKLGVYGLVRVVLDLLGGGPTWWGIVVLTAGVVSALFGILHAMVTPDLKRLLAYSTTENVGIILVGVGGALLFSAAGSSVLAATVLAAALLHSLNHALFKGLLFMGAGSVLHATGTRDLDRLGGLLRRMPWTGALFGVGAMAIAALPPLNGFVSEWVLLQGLLRSFPASDTAVAVMVPVALGAVALTGGIAAATFVKAFGTGFLALPRSEAAERAHESPLSMRAGMVLLAAGCVVLGVGPMIVVGALGHALGPVRAVASPGVAIGDSWQVTVAGVGSAFAPLAVATALLVAVAAVAAAARTSSRRPARRLAVNWGCGRVGQTSAMEYNATSFAEPVQRVFDDVMRPDMDLEVDHWVESSYFVERVRFRTSIRDGTERHLYEPVIRFARRWGELARALQNGSVHRYLAYGFVTILVVLAVAR